MPSLTRWTRLEPVNRDPSMRGALQGRVYDPAWLLGRQWQVGEFTGDDSGSPASARLALDIARLTRYQPADALARDYSDAAPLEALVEADAIRAQGTATLFDRAEAGLHLLRMLDARPVSAATRQAFINGFVLQPRADANLDAEARRYATMVKGRIPDGVAVYEHVKSTTGGPSAALPHDVATPDRASVLEALSEWIAWFDALFMDPARPPDAWKPERMEYTFRVGAQTADGEIVLQAPEFRGGHLDWDAFDVEPQASLGAARDGEQRITTVLPSPATFRGMPASRWWEFEDAQVDLGAIEAEPEDLSRLLLIEFAVSSGDDWFVVPVDLPCGSIGTTRSLIVTDTFGVRTLIPPYQQAQSSSPQWRMWSLSGSERALQQPFLFIAPAVAAAIESAPIEELRLMRDEVANMAWAIERVVAGENGRPLDRFGNFQESEQRRAESQQAVKAGPDDPLQYRLMSTVPDYWLPLLPEKADGTAIRLRRGAMRDRAGGLIPPRGRLLGGPADRSIQLLPDEEVPRAGSRVLLRYRYARWLGGRTVLWLGRRKAAGTGEGSSGLRFDWLEPTPDG